MQFVLKPCTFLAQLLDCPRQISNWFLLWPGIIAGVRHSKKLGPTLGFRAVNCV